MRLVGNELPPRTPSGRPARFQDEAKELRDNPGLWFLLVEASGAATAGSMASTIRTGGYRAFRPAGHFQASTRGAYVYVRYVGGAS